MRTRTHCILAVLTALLLAIAVPAECKSRSFLPSASRTGVNTHHRELLDNKKAWQGVAAVTTAPPRGGGDLVTPAQKKEILGALAFVALNEVFRFSFTANGIKFPPQLGGCIILFTTLVVSQLVFGIGDSVFQALVPGAGLLAKWLPVFFVPGLAMLPRAPSVGTGLDVTKILAITGIGFLFSLSSTGFSVLALRTAQGSVVAAAPAPAPPPSKQKGGKAAVAPAPAPPAKPFSSATLDFLTKGSLLAAAVSIAATRTDHAATTPLRTLFFGFSTVAAYVWAARLPSGFVKIVHPLVTATSLTLLFVQLYGMLTGSNFMDTLATYKVGSLAFGETGAGDLLLHLLGPAVVSFSISMYSRKKLLKENLPVVLLAMLVSSVGGLFGTALAVRLLQLGGKAAGRLVRLSVLPRNVTTPLAIAITNILGGDISIAASVVVMTGIIAATYGRTVLDKLGIQDPISRGLAVGAAGQGLGVASMLPEADAFPFAAMAMVLTAVCSTSLVSIPAVKDTIINLATGA